MKKLIALAFALATIGASAYDITNTVTIVSNIYNRIYEEHWITNHVKDTHTNYYYTNNFYIVSNKTLIVSQQTFKTNTTVNLDVSQQAIADARAEANRAASLATNAYSYANRAASSATSAQSHAFDAMGYRDEAQYYMEQAHGQVQPIIDEGQRQLAAIAQEGTVQVSRVSLEGNYQVVLVDSAGRSNVGSVNNAGSTMLNSINEKQQWFDDHFGQRVTNITHNAYHPEATMEYYLYGQQDMTQYGVRASIKKYWSGGSGTVQGIYTCVGRVLHHVGAFRYNSRQYNWDKDVYIYLYANKDMTTQELLTTSDGIPFFRRGMSFAYNDEHNEIRQVYWNATGYDNGPVYAGAYHYDMSCFSRSFVDYGQQQCTESSTSITYPFLDETYDAHISPTMRFYQGLSDVGIYLISLSNWVERVFQKK